MIDLEEFRENIAAARSRLDTVNIMNEQLGSVAMRPIRWVVNNSGSLLDRVIALNKEVEEYKVLVEKFEACLDSLPVDVEEMLGS